ncbi:hypothetical protein KM043_015728 [Ampulex compressa]|nr:hypothetical protein KM043_015728 [Ampulex compressa]
MKLAEKHEMHKKTQKRNTYSTLTQKIKVPEHLERIKDYRNSQNKGDSSIQLPSLQKWKSGQNSDKSPVSWNQNSTATSASWSPEVEDAATYKLIQQWDAIERTLYDEDDQIPEGTIFDECVQWRNQIPHLRIVGINPFISNNDRYSASSINDLRAKSNFGSQNDEINVSQSFSTKDTSSTSRHTPLKREQEKVLKAVLEYVAFQLLSNNEDKEDSLNDNLSEILRISPAPASTNKCSAKNFQRNYLEGSGSYEERCFDNQDKLLEARSFSRTIKEEVNKINRQRILRHDNSAYSTKSKASAGVKENDVCVMEERLFIPQMGRNKLGTVFNEKIVVSPVPFVLSTRESFSTLKTMPIKFMEQPVELPAFQALVRNSASITSSRKKSNVTKNSNVQSAWHAPVSPAVWPKNIKLAPIDTSTLPRSKNRSLAPSPAVVQRNRKSLSPILHSTLRTDNDEILEIQGKQIAPCQSAQLTLLSSGFCLIL